MTVGVVGAGIAGSAAAYALSRRGASVHVFDQHEQGNNEGASHGESRLIRLAYFEHPDYVPALRAAYAGWRDLEQEAGEVLFRRTGLVQAGPASSGLINGVMRAAEDHNLCLEKLSRRDMAERGEILNLPEHWVTLFEENAGYLLAERALCVFQRAAAERGAQFHWGEKAQGLVRDEVGLTLATSKRQLSLDRLIVTPGPWADETFRALGLPQRFAVTPVEKVNCWFGADKSAAATTPFAVENGVGGFFYGMPAVNDNGVKIGAHYAGNTLLHPRDRSRDCIDEEMTISNFVREYIPGVRPDPVKRKHCLYEVSPDSHFAVDRAPQDPRIAYAAGLSGHGFKFAPILGEWLADLASDAPPPPNAAFLSAERFR